MSGGRHHLHEEGGAPRAEVALFGFYFVMERFSVKRFLKSTPTRICIEHRRPGSTAFVGTRSSIEYLSSPKRANNWARLGRSIKNASCGANFERQKTDRITGSAVQSIRVKAAP
jgi:hypothetical protein